MGLKPRGAKAKGDRYERELAQHFNEKVFDGKDVVFRAPLSGGGRNIGGGGQADLTGTPKVWIEAKRTERFQPYQAMEQAEKGIECSRCPDIPVVINRKSQVKTDDSLVVMRLRDWLDMYSHYLKLTADKGDDKQTLLPVASE